MIQDFGIHESGLFRETGRSFPKKVGRGKKEMRKRDKKLCVKRIQRVQCEQVYILLFLEQRLSKEQEKGFSLMISVASAKEAGKKFSGRKKEGKEDQQ